MSIIVAVAADLSLPPQQSEMLGHRASSHTVCRFKPRRSDLIFLKFSLFGMGVLSHAGRRVISFCLPAGPTRAVRSSRASEGESEVEGLETKEERLGPLLRRSWKVVRGRGLEGGFVGGEGTAVAKARRIV